MLGFQPNAAKLAALGGARGRTNWRSNAQGPGSAVEVDSFGDPLWLGKVIASSLQVLRNRPILTNAASQHRLQGHDREQRRTTRRFDDPFNLDRGDVGSRVVNRSLDRLPQGRRRGGTAMAAPCNRRRTTFASRPSNVTSPP